MTKRKRTSNDLQHTPLNLVSDHRHVKRHLTEAGKTKANQKITKTLHQMNVGERAQLQNMLKQLAKHQLTLSMTECPRVNKFKFG